MLLIFQSLKFSVATSARGANLAELSAVTDDLSCLFSLPAIRGKELAELRMTPSSRQGGGSFFSRPPLEKPGRQRKCQVTELTRRG